MRCVDYLRINKLRQVVNINLWIVLMDFFAKHSSAIVTLFTFSVMKSKVDSEVLGKQLLCGNQVFISSLFNRWEAG